MKKLLLLLALLFACHVPEARADGARVETYPLKGFPIGQPRNNLLPKNSKDCRPLTSAMIAGGSNWSNTTTGGFRDSTASGLYTGVSDDSVKSVCTTVNISPWYSAWVPMFGARLVVIHITHSATDSAAMIQIGASDTVNFVPTTLNPLAAQTNAQPVYASGNPSPSSTPNIGVWVHCTGTNVPPVSASGVSRPASGEGASAQNTVFKLMPFQSNNSLFEQFIYSRYFRVAILQKAVGVGSNCGKAWAGLGSTRVWAEVVYDNTIPQDWISDYYRGAVPQ